MMQVMCNQDIKRICDGTCNDPCCMQKHPPTTYALQAADEVRAKFEEWMKSREGFPFAHQYANLMWASWQAAHASRDAEVEALQSDAAIGRYVLKYGAWIRDGDDTIMEIRFTGHVDLSSVGTRRDAIEAAMRNND